MSVTIWEVAEARGVQKGPDGSVNGGEFYRVGLPFFGGCEVCGASIAAYNASPSQSGYLRCTNGCIGDDGFPTVAEFEKWWQEDEA